MELKSENKVLRSLLINPESKTPYSDATQVRERTFSFFSSGVGKKITHFAIFSFQFFTILFFCYDKFISKIHLIFRLFPKKSYNGFLQKKLQSKKKKYFKRFDFL